MTQYIDKDALVSEIEKLQLCTMDEHNNFYSAEAQGEYYGLSKLDSFLDTLEVKKVDLQSEIDRVWDNTSDNFSEDGWKEFEDIAKHFFKLGFKTQKGKEL